MSAPSRTGVGADPVEQSASGRTVRRSSMTADVAWTTLATIALIAGNAALAYVLARRGAVQVFGPYNLTRRLASAAMPVLLLGLNLGVARRLAQLDEGRLRRASEVAAILIAVATLSGVTLLVVVAPARCSTFVLGKVDVGLIWAMWIYTVGVALTALAYSVYRGEFLQGRANWTNLIAVVFLPLAVVTLAPGSWSAAWLLLGSGVLMCLWSAGHVAVRLAAGVRAGVGYAQVRHESLELVRYSAPRAPGLLAAAGILAIGPTVAARGGAALVSSYLLAGMSFIQIGNAAMAGFNIVLLPRVSEMHSERRTGDIREMSGRMIFLILCLSAFAVPTLVVVCRDIVRMWLGPAFLPGVPTIQVLLLSIPALVAFSVLTSVTDAAISRPISTYAGVAGFLVCLVGSVLLPAGDSVRLAVMFVVGQSVAGAWIVGTLLVHYGPDVALPYAGSVVAIGVLCAGLLAYTTSWGGPDVLLSAVRVGGSAAIIVGGTTAALWFAPRRLGFRPLLSRLAGGRLG